MSDERYVVKLASGRWLNDDRREVDSLRLAFKACRSEAYRIAAMYGAVALRLRPSARAAELAKLRAEVEELREWGRVHVADTVDAETKLDVMTAERDALAAKLAELPPDVTDEELANCRRLLRGPVAPARPVEELRDELVKAWNDSPPGVDEAWLAVAKRARELGAR